MEEKAKYNFLRTIEKDGHYIALIADRDILGDAGVESLRLAFNAHACPLTRTGLLLLCLEQLETRLPILEQQRKDKSLENCKLAIRCIKNKSAAAKPATKPAQLHT